MKNISLVKDDGLGKVHLEIYDGILGGGNDTTGQTLAGSVLFDNLAYGGETEIDQVIDTGNIITT